MPRKQVGLIDLDLLDRVDEQAKVLGQTRRVFVERALEQALSDSPTGGEREVVRSGHVAAVPRHGPKLPTPPRPKGSKR